MSGNNVGGDKGRIWFVLFRQEVEEFFQRMDRDFADYDLWYIYYIMQFTYTEKKGGSPRYWNLTSDLPRSS